MLYGMFAAKLDFPHTRLYGFFMSLCTGDLPTPVRDRREHIVP